MSVNQIRAIVLVLVLLIAGACLTFSGISDVMKLNGEIPDFNFDSMQDIESGDFVGGYVPLIVGCYAEETTTNSSSSYTSEEYFLMPLMNDADWDKDLYITISAANYDDRRKLYDICDQTYEYYDGNENVQFTEMPIICKVKKMDSDLEPLLLECFREAEWYENDAEAREHYLPYELVIYDSSPYTDLVIGVILLAAGTVIALIGWKKLHPKQEIETAYNAGYVPPSPAENSGGFAENAPEPFPDIPQPPDPDEFFARTPKEPEQAVQPEQEPVPRPEPQVQTVPVDCGDMDALDTSSLSLDDLDN